MSSCVIDCEFCPQDVIRNSYKSEIKSMSLESFKKIIDKIPDKSVVSFAGFCENFINNDTPDMILYAHSQGHFIHVLTNTLGLTIEKYNKIKHIPFLSFSIHIPDTDNKTPIVINDKYKILLKYIVENPPVGLLFNHHSGGIHNDISDIVTFSYLLEINDRAGNLQNSDILHKFQEDICGCRHAFLFTYVDGGCIVLPNGDCILCCMDWSLEYKLGNLFNQSWNEIIENLNIKEICKKCIFSK